MDAGRIRLLGMSSDVWRRHASGWSVWTRFATLPFLYLAVWSHTIYGWTAAAGLSAIVVGWLWLNPRIFPAPNTFERWHARAVLGERIWLNRAAIPVPHDENRKALAFSALAGVGFFAGLWGAISASLPLMISGAVVTYAGKLAFLAVMVQIYDLMRNAHPLYRSWTLTPVNDNERAGGRHERAG
ncbi:hypothetical protein HPQ64_15500 [Rhizobiales bacterium]|nr:hypothetical protein [Hongsoonwoonella zoysiae]